MKDHAETFSLDEEFQIIDFLSKIATEEYKKEYRYIRFGVTQVAFKPLTTSGLDYPIFTAFRDNKSICHKDSLFVMIQTVICYGPICYKCRPNYSVELNDDWIIDALLLDIHLPNIQNNLKVQFREFSRNFAIMYNVYFKLLSSQHNPKCILKPCLDETMLLKAELDNLTTFTPQLLKWNEITISQEFIFEILDREEILLKRMFHE